MRIAFDLDNTLIRCNFNFPLEHPQRRWWARVVRGEDLRQGIQETASFCRRHNHELWVYTTSYRSIWSIRLLFWLHGIWLHGVVNQQRHNREVRVRCSKHPPGFGIDLLIDDSEGVRLEGERLGFRVLVVSPEDANWVAKVQQEISS